MKKLLLLVCTISTVLACQSIPSIDDPNNNADEVEVLKWKWLNTGFEDYSQKRIIYDEAFGEGNSLRLHQSMCIYADRAFCINDGIECKVLDLRTKEWLVSDDLPDKSHHNNAQFSNTFLSSSDKYPLLLLTRGDYPPSQNDLIVVRVSEESNRFVYSVVKTIHVKIKEAEYCGSWVVDDENDKLFLYCMTTGDWRVKDGVNHFCIFSFNLPCITSSEDVTLGYEDVLERWDYPYLIHQGGVYYNGYLLFNVQSMGPYNGKKIASSKDLILVNSENGDIEAIMPLDEKNETEGISIYDNRLYVSFKEGSKSQSSKSIVFNLNDYTLPSSILARKKRRR